MSVIVATETNKKSHAAGIKFKLMNQLADQIERCVHHVHISVCLNTTIYFRIAGIKAPAGGAFFALNSSHICSIVTHST